MLSNCESQFSSADFLWYKLSKWGGIKVGFIIQNTNMNMCSLLTIITDCWTFKASAVSFFLALESQLCFDVLIKFSAAPTSHSSSSAFWYLHYTEGLTFFHFILFFLTYSTLMYDAVGFLFHKTTLSDCVVSLGLLDSLFFQLQASDSVFHWTRRLFKFFGNISETNYSTSPSSFLVKLSLSLAEKTPPRFLFRRLNLWFWRSDSF